MHHGRHSSDAACAIEGMQSLRAVRQTYQNAVPLTYSLLPEGRGEPVHISQQRLVFDRFPHESVRHIIRVLVRSLLQTAIERVGRIFKIRLHRAVVLQPRSW
ncbi:hypothetical protein SDC9_158603 [bioreactor metagenome]|uniref:Uncharacterized protein n=1 Tax=bioreactor metagenome TaxID=1076179 RepID=A0A645FCK0_9ZZZZ